MKEVGERQHSYLNQNRKRGLKIVAWRPAKRYRLGAKAFLQNLDNQIRQIGGDGGLATFQREERPEELAKLKSERWRHWSTWPHMNIALDQGSDGLSAVCFTKHRRLCFTEWWDFSHGCKNDWKQMLKDAGLWNMWLLYMMNTSSGPSNDDTRWGELDAAWKQMLALRCEQVP